MLKAGKKVSTFLGSLHLALFLIIAIAIVSLIGIIIPQGLHPEHYIHQWGTGPGTIILSTGIDHIFTTTWFYLLLLLFCGNILFCSGARILKKSHKASFLSGRNDLSRYKNILTGTTSLDPESAKSRIVAQLKKMSYTVMEKRNEQNGFQVAAHKGKIRDIGSFVFHIGIVALMLGGIIGTKFGYSIHKELSCGQITSIPDRDFLLRCDSFKLKTDADGALQDYLSELSLLNPDSSLIMSKTIEVNDPLSYKGIKFYQSSYGQSPTTIKDISIAIRGKAIPGELFTGIVPYNKPFIIPGTTALTLHISTFLPDFMIDRESRSATSRSREPNNPAVKALLLQGADTLFYRWVFLNFPDQHMQGAEYKIVATSFTPAFYTGIQIRKNPGVPVIWIGIIMMTLGIVALFYCTRSTMRVFIEPTSEGYSRITLGTTSQPSPADSLKEFTLFKEILSLQQES